MSHAAEYCSWLFDNVDYIGKAELARKIANLPEREREEDA